MELGDGDDGRRSTQVDRQLCQRRGGDQGGGAPVQRRRRRSPVRTSPISPATSPTEPRLRRRHAQRRGTSSVDESTIGGNSAVRAGGGIETTTGGRGPSPAYVADNEPAPHPATVADCTSAGAGSVNVTGLARARQHRGTEGGGLWNGTGTMTVDSTRHQEQHGEWPRSRQRRRRHLSADRWHARRPERGRRSSATALTEPRVPAAGLQRGATVNVSGTEFDGNDATRAGGGIERQSRHRDDHGRLGPVSTATARGQPRATAARSTSVARAPSPSTGARSPTTLRPTRAAASGTRRPAPSPSPTRRCPTV